MMITPKVSVHKASKEAIKHCITQSLNNQIKQTLERQQQPQYYLTWDKMTVKERIDSLFPAETPGERATELK